MAMNMNVDSSGSSGMQSSSLRLSSDSNLTENQNVASESGIASSVCVTVARNKPPMIRPKAASRVAKPEKKIMKAQTTILKRDLSPSLRSDGSLASNVSKVTVPKYVSLKGTLIKKLRDSHNCGPRFYNKRKTFTLNKSNFP